MFFIFFVNLIFASTEICEKVIQNDTLITNVDLKNKKTEGTHLNSNWFDFNGQKIDLDISSGTCSVDNVNLEYSNKKTDGELWDLNHTPFVYDKKLYISFGKKRLSLKDSETIGEVVDNKIKLLCSIRQKILKTNKVVENKNKELCNSYWSGESKTFPVYDKKIKLTKEDLVEFYDDSEFSGAGCGCSKFKTTAFIEKRPNHPLIAQIESLNPKWECSSDLPQKWKGLTYQGKDYLLLESDYKEGDLAHSDVKIKDSVLYSWNGTKLVKECSTSFETKKVSESY